MFPTYTVFIDPYFALISLRISVTIKYKGVVFRLKTAVNYGTGKRQASAEVLRLWEKKLDFNMLFSTFLQLNS